MRLGRTKVKSASGGISRAAEDDRSRRTGQANVHVDRGRDNDPEEFALEMEEVEMVQPEQGSRNRRATSNRQAKRAPEMNLKSRGRIKMTGPQGTERKQSDRGQGISNRKATTEKQRQNKVIPIRSTRGTKPRKRAS
jgi:hypothetical protein